MYIVLQSNDKTEKSIGVGENLVAALVSFHSGPWDNDYSDVPISIFAMSM